MSTTLNPAVGYVNEWFSGRPFALADDTSGHPMLHASSKDMAPRVTAYGLANEWGRFSATLTSRYVNPNDEPHLWLRVDFTITELRQIQGWQNPIRQMVDMCHLGVSHSALASRIIRERQTPSGRYYVNLRLPGVFHQHGHPVLRLP